jgi:C4-dicarboxylate transporter
MEFLIVYLMNQLFPNYGLIITRAASSWTVIASSIPSQSSPKENYNALSAKIAKMNAFIYIKTNINNLEDN